MHVLTRIEVGPRNKTGKNDGPGFNREETGRKAALTAMTSLVDPPLPEDEEPELSEGQSVPTEQESENSDASLSIAALCAAYLAEED